jgi:hypothetical protein
LFVEVDAAVVEALEAVVCDYDAGHGGSGDDGDLREVHCWLGLRKKLVVILKMIEELLRLLLMWLCSCDSIS